MSEATPATLRARLGPALAFVRAAEPRRPLSRRSRLFDLAIAGLFLAASLTAAVISAHTARQLLYDPATGTVAMSQHPPHGVLGPLGWGAFAAPVVTSVPLAARRRYPLICFLVVVAGMLATRQYATDIAFLAMVFAAHAALVHSPYRGAALLAVPLLGVVTAALFWDASPVSVQVRSFPTPTHLLFPGLRGYKVGVAAGTGSTPWRATALVVMVALISITLVVNAMHVADSQRRLRQMQTDHEAATRRAVEEERTRIAGELHDVVTHNVSVMIVQAGAARQVLAGDPGEARTALLAVESSGRAAMAELRHLLGLLSPVSAASATADGENGGVDTAGPGTGDGLSAADLRPQPGLGQLGPLIDRVRAAGLPVELDAGHLPPGLPPGLDLAAFRVVQEALTNVIKHAGRPRTIVRFGCRGGDLVVEVADAGAPVPAVTPLVGGAGRGLLGLRERVSLYGGDLDAGPRPEGGWRVRARIPVDPALAGPCPPGEDDPAAAGTAVRLPGGTG